MLSIALAFSLQLSSPLAVVDDTIRAEHDIIDYDIVLSIPDRGSSINAVAQISYVVKSGSGPLVLDFDDALVVDSVLLHDAGARASGSRWKWDLVPGANPDFLVIDQWGQVGDTLSVAIHYHGRPADGLVIADNPYGKRTAFADNWPNRARHWFPCEDHPSDKARVSFTVGVPDEWSVVANGRLLGVDTLENKRTTWRWREDRPIPVHTMVIGAGEMTVAALGQVDGVPLTAWTFPQDSAFAVEQPLRRANEIVAVFNHLIGPFPYEKLAHVESSTRYGGMENSSAIFYSAAAYQSRRMGEGLVAHETAHQWFGDAVSQFDWHHLWLSEGFATYFGALFFESAGETETFVSAMRSNKRRYMESAVVNRPVIDTTVQDPFDLLNANNYQKGAWILHMLRHELGDSSFFAGIREFYGVYRDSTALSGDLAAIMTRHAGRPMDWFFQQWLLQPGYPELEIYWSFNPQAGSVALAVHQTQPSNWGKFSFTLPVQFEFADGSTEREQVLVDRWEYTKEIAVDQRPTGMVVDPEDTLLVGVVKLEQGR
jgi:aminopeptidase N